MPVESVGVVHPEAGHEKTIAFANPSTQAGFTQIPNALLRSTSVSTYAKLVYAIFASYAWQKEECYPGQERVAEQVPCSVRALRNALRELEQLGLLTTQRRGMGETNLYRLHEVPINPEPHADQSGTTRRSIRQAVPTKKTQGEEDSVEEDTARPRAASNGRAEQLCLDGLVAPMRPSRKKSSVGTAAERRLAGLVLAEFNSQAGTSYTASSYVDMIVRRIEEHPELLLTSHADVIKRNLAAPWWTGKASPNVIYGNAEQFERSMHSEAVIEPWVNYKPALRITDSDPDPSDYDPVAGAIENARLIAEWREERGRV